MTNTDANLPEKPSKLPPLQLGLAIAIGIFFGIEFFSAMRKENDFLWHIEQGRAFLSRDLYNMSGVWYPLTRQMWDGLLALLGHRPARFVSYVAAVALTIWGFRIWAKMAEACRPIGPMAALLAAEITFIVCLTVVRRDLDDCGLQLLMLGMLTAGAWAYFNGRERSCGAFFALAALYKTTPVLLLPLLLWKRQWTAALWMTGIIALGSLLPVLWLGPDKSAAYQLAFFQKIEDSSAIEDPARNAIERPKPDNQSLQSFVVRYVQTYEPGQGMYVEHPLNVQFFDLSDKAAKRAVQAVTLALLALLAWRTWPKRDEEAERMAWPRQWATLCVMLALVSPLAWKQHLALALPAAFFVFHDLLADRGRPRWRLALVIIASILLFFSSRGFVGDELSAVVLSYKSFTWGALIFAALCLFPPQPERLATD